MTARLLVVLVAAMMVAEQSAAQTAAPMPQTRTFTASAGIISEGGYAVGDSVAELRGNSMGAPSPFTLFRTEATFENAIGLDARLGVALTRLFSLEVGGTYAQPRLGVTIFQDPEAETGASAHETISQFTVDVSGAYQLPFRLGSRAASYVIGGGGYFRQLHQDRLLAETGQTAHFGGGVRYWWRGASGKGRPAGVRGEVRYVRRFGGIDFEEASRGFPVVSLLGFVGF